MADWSSRYISPQVRNDRRAGIPSHARPCGNGANRKLDADITAALIGGRAGWEVDGLPGYVINDKDELEKSKRLTASLDAALALVERCLPGVRIIICCGEESYSSCELRGKRGPYNGPMLGDDERADDCVALAALAALLTALIAKEAKP